VDLHTEFRGHVESVCSRGLLVILRRTKDDAWDFFKKLAWNAYECKQVRETLRHNTHDLYAFHVNPHHQDHFRNSYGTHLTLV